jgi:signal peptidase I
MNDLISQLLEYTVIGIFFVFVYELIFLGRRKLALVDDVAKKILSDNNHTKAQLEAFKQNISNIKKSPAWLEQVKLWFIPAIIFMVIYKIYFNQESINFPLYLVLAVFASGLIALFDILFLKRKRMVIEEKLETLISAEESYEALNQQLVSVEYSKSFFPILLLVLVLRSFLFEPFTIPSSSMVPTLEISDYILVNKFTYGIRLPVIRTKVLDNNDPKRGDVMVFFPPHDKRYFIKRVMGLPGDKIRYADNQVYVNGKAVENHFIATQSGKNLRDEDRCKFFNQKYQIFDEVIEDKTHKMRKCTIPIAFPGDKTWTVPEGHYFMMGDNRDNSSDSRDWGFVPEKNIVGKAFAIWMHWEGIPSLPSFSRVGPIE